MTHTYNISGMTCNACVAKAKSQLLMLGDVVEAEVKLTAPQATIKMQKHIPVSVLQNAIKKAGNYQITEVDENMHNDITKVEGIPWFKAYAPILLIGAYIIGITLIIELVRNGIDWEIWMRNFMAGFFLVFSFFKLLDLKGFAESYATYDLIGKKWLGWGYVYAFLELSLGLAYLINFNPLLTNAITFVVMSISIVGVIQAVLSKRKIQCACLGAVFNLPMSTITIIEDALMIVMSGIMIIKHY